MSTSMGTRLYFDADLPDLPPNPVIYLHRQQLEEFRAAFRELLMFAATICGKPVGELRAGDAMAKLPDPFDMSQEHLEYWRCHPAYLSWLMIIEMTGYEE